MLARLVSEFQLKVKFCKMDPSCPLGISRVGSARKSFLFGHIINPLVTKLDRSRWLDIGLGFFLAFLLTLTWSRSIKTQKRTWPISSLVDLALGQNDICNLRWAKPKPLVRILFKF